MSKTQVAVRRKTQLTIKGLALSAIVATCAAGCMSPAAPPSGLQRQIEQGAKADAGGPPQAGSVTPSPAGSASVAAGTAGRGAANTQTAGLTSAKVTGKDITAVGDSVMLAVSVPLHQAFPGIYVNAVVSRHTFEGLNLLRQLKSTGSLRPVVIVGLGTNGGVSTQQIRQLVAIVGSKRKVVLVNTFVPLPYEQPTNRVLAAAARTYPNVTLANWYKIISVRTRLLWPDGIHPMPPGAKIYAAMIKTAVEQAVHATGG